MDPTTWLLIAAAILTAQYITTKISEKRPNATRITPLQEERPSIMEEELEQPLIEPIIQPLEEPAPKTPEQEKRKVEEDEPKPRKAENKTDEKEEKPEKPKENETKDLTPEMIQEISARISELKTLLETSQNLKKELEKLAFILNPQKPGKELIRPEKKIRTAPR